MGKRQRSRERISAAPSEYRDAEGNVLSLRGSLTAGTRRALAQAAAGEGRPSASLEDSWQRAGEMLFERLALRWDVAGVPTTGQRELLARYRVASSAEREWIRGVLREHCREHFPDVQAP